MAGGVSVVLDIDGVLVRGGTAIDGAKEALALLDEARIPWALLTNGGAVVEEVKALKLEKILGYPIPPERMILSHTPMRPLAEKYREVPCLVTGPWPGTCDVMKAYGFQKVVHVKELLEGQPNLKNYGSGEALPVSDVAAAVLRGEEEIGAVFVLEDPPDWQGSAQLILDASRGTLSTPPRPPKALTIYVNNPDIVTPQGHHTPRLTVGAFKLALQAIADAEGVQLRFEQYGKPHSPNYQWAEKVLCATGTIVMVGDNPLSDIRGANKAGAQWRSVLTRTGIYKEGPPAVPADLIVEDVREAVQLLLKNEIPVKGLHQQ